MVDYIIPFSDEQSRDASLVGGKGAGLGQLVHHGFDVPAGFTVSHFAFEDGMSLVGIDGRTVGALLSSHPASYANIQKTSAGLRERTLKITLPNSMRDELRDAVARLNGSIFAVRSSAIGEDSASSSFAGMNETFTNLRTLEEIEDAIVRCWASAFGQRVLSYRALQHLSAPISMAVIVQVMIDARRSGVMFTRDPASEADDTVVIEGALGQGEVVVGGHIEPDHYAISRAPDGVSPDRIVVTNIGRKDFMITQDARGARVRTDLHGPAATEPSLSAVEAIDLAGIGLLIEQRLGAPQDVEWCIDGAGRIWILQSRPITTRSPAATPVTAATSGSEPPPLMLRGLAAAPGRITGTIRKVATLDDAPALRAGEILVTEMTTPEWIAVISRASGVITDRGGVTSHAAIVSRELGVPAVVGTRIATQSLIDGETVTVDGALGTVERLGATAPNHTRPVAEATPSAESVDDQTRTKVFVNLSHPRNARVVAQTPGVAGVGLLRAEFLLTQALGGVHPKTLIAAGRSDEFVDVLANALEEIAVPFGDRPVIYRAADFRSNEFRLLQGGDAFEPVEENPMIGYRGCFRYVKEPELFQLELQALDRVRALAPGLALMLPFVRTLWELERCIEIVVDCVDPGLPRLPIWIMAEVPSVLYRLHDYRSLGITGISIGSNDLTQLMLGVDRDSEICSELFNEQDDAVLRAIADIISRARSEGLSTSLCGQAPSNNPAFAGSLVRMGIDSVSVDPSAVTDVRRNLLLAEASSNT